MTTLAELARAFADAFETKNRDDGSKFLCLRDGSPDWMTDAVREVHDGRMPNDGDYRAASAIADSIAETLEYDADADLDDAGEQIDGLVPVYNRDRVNWLSENLSRSDYISEAVENGMFQPSSDIFEQIGGGMYVFYSQAWNHIVEALRDQGDGE